MTNTIKIVKSKTASIDVDPQQGFSELCPAELPVEGALNIVEELLHNHQKASVCLVSRDMHPSGALWEASSPDEMLASVGLPEVDVKWNPHCIVGTLGCELLPGLPSIRDYDFQINKGLDPDAHPYGAFYHDNAEKLSTGGIEFLRAKEIDTVIVGGLALDFCVKKSVEQLLDANFKVIVNLASTRAVLKQNSESVISELTQKGAVFVKNAVAIQFTNASVLD